MSPSASAPIDLRSDTVTQPSPPMREAMAKAPVGDDQYGEDPTVNELEHRFCRRLGKEAAVFVASGTMANQVALNVLTRRGDEVIVGGEAHVLWHEKGSAAALAGVQINALGTSGIFTADDVRTAAKPPDHMVFPSTGLVVVENTHNRGGGIVFPHEEATAICTAASELGLATYLDGARLFNAAFALNLDIATLAEPFRMVSVSLSKGLGCPVGSILAGSQADIAEARRIRRMYGGAMRQAGILAAAGLYALDHNVERLPEDHKNARAMAEILKEAPGITLDIETVQTNIIIFRMAEGALTAAALADRAREKGVKISPFGGRTVRITTHLDVTHDQCIEAAEILRTILAKDVAR